MDLLNPGPQQQAQRQLLTEQQIAQMHDLADALQKNALDTRPIYSKAEGYSKLADAAVSVLAQARQAQGQRDIADYAARHAAGAFGGAGGDPTQPLAPNWTPDQPPTGQQQSYSVIQGEKDAIAANESGGNYAEIGPHVKANWSHPAGYAVGKYQVMSYDLPQKLKEAGLPSMSEGEFLANPDAQEKQFNYEFGKLRSEHSFADSASMWHSGVPLERAIKEGRTDGYMTTRDYVSKALKYLNPISPAGAAELTPQQLQAAGQAQAPTFANRFGNQPQTFDQSGNPLPAGAPPSTFDQRFGGPPVPTPMPRPTGMGPGGVADPSIPNSIPPAAPRPQIQVTPTAQAAPVQQPPASGQPMPGAMSPAERSHIYALMQQPATAALGWKLFDQYIAPQERTAITGYKYFGAPGAGFRPLPEPGTPTEQPGSQHVFGTDIPSLPLGSRTGRPYGQPIPGVDPGATAGPPPGARQTEHGLVNSKGIPINPDGTVDQGRVSGLFERFLQGLASPTSR